MILLAILFIQAAYAQSSPPPPSAPDVVQKIETTRDGIRMDEHRQREILSRLFLIDHKVKEIASRQKKLNGKLQAQQVKIEGLAKEVGGLEQKADYHRNELNKRLRELYQDREGGSFHWLFMAKSPVELDRDRKFLELLADSDHDRLKTYLSSLRELKKKRNELKGMVAKLLQLRRIGQSQQQEMSRQMNAKADLLAQLKEKKRMKLSVLKSLRRQDTGVTLAYVFFERKGTLHPPIAAPVRSEYGIFVDPKYKFRLMHKGTFYTARRGTPVHAIFGGKVAVAQRVPGYGRLIILDHGDNYYSVYAFASKLKVREGAKVKEGQLIAFSGASSPLFGPGLYFEIRHFTDAIDPRPWINESVIKTANSY